MTMAKLIQWVGMTIFGIVAFATTALSKPPTQTNQPLTSPAVLPSVMMSTASDEPFCYFQTTNRRTIDLSKLCGISTGSAPSLQVTYPQPPRVYDQKVVQAFDESLYGPNN